MAYTYDQVEYELAAAQAFTSTGDKLTWAPGYVPHYIRAVALGITTAFTVTNAVVNFTTRGTIGSNSGISAGDIAILKVLTSYTAGQIVYKDGIEKLLKPGQELVVNVGTASTAGNANVSIFAEPSLETPANNTNMVLTT